ncbi:MAG: DUF4145 domain-containing protein [Abditibacteriota bacterium]|nr:DUF4145 domain-containing protein [Abditibacteriota bacterium]
MAKKDPMECPHCGKGIYIEFTENKIVNGNNEVGDNYILLLSGFCPFCKNPIVLMKKGELIENYQLDTSIKDYLWGQETIYPKFLSKDKLSEYIPNDYQKEYNDVKIIKDINPKASACLCRYLLQKILHEELKINKGNLHKELEELESIQKIPSELCEMLQILRKVTNSGAHPNLDKKTCEIIETEPGEIEIMLEILKQLFDFVFVKPKMYEKAKLEWNEKYGIKIDK